jgi:hypothetical protein
VQYNGSVFLFVVFSTRWVARKKNIEKAWKHYLRDEPILLVQIKKTTSLIFALLKQRVYDTPLPIIHDCFPQSISIFGG